MKEEGTETAWDDAAAALQSDRGPDTRARGSDKFDSVQEDYFLGS